MKCALSTMLMLGSLVPGCAYANARGDDGSDSIADVFARVQNSVVAIRTSESIVVDTGPGAIRTSVGGIGSGVLIDDAGRILTAAHVVQIADQVVVEFPDGSRRDARVVSSEPGADVAMIQLETPAPEIAVVARIGDSSLTRVGEPVFVVGAPLGVAHTLTVGHLSAHRRSDRVLRGAPYELLQTDAAINQGNSGGPLFNRKGEVIGIVSHIISQTGGSDGLGFAISSNMTRTLLLEQSSFWSGLEGVQLSPALAKALNVPPPGEGMLVLRVARSSPSARLGLRGGTIPVKFSGEDLLLGGDVILTAIGIPAGGDDASTQVREAFLALEDGETYTIRVLRQGVKIDLEGTRRVDPAAEPSPASANEKD